jgi:hypothetical protein
MSLDDYKIGDFAEPVSAMGDNPSADGLTAAQIKAWFDSNSNEIKTAFNALIDALTADGGGELVKGVNIRYMRINGDDQIEISVDGESWEATASSGHIIEDEYGNTYPQRTRLMFAGEIEDTGTETFVRGITGPAGPQGPAGETGSQGIQGPEGKVYYPTVSDEGVLSWELTEPDEDPPLSVSIRGPQGQTGERGPRGYTGSTGSTGPQGVQGIQGIAGADGRSLVILGRYETLALLEAAHPTGDAGDAWAVGTYDDNMIYIWDTDELEWTCLGAIWCQPGPQGVQGIQGIQGVPGESGESGETAYEAAVSGGYTGTEEEFNSDLAQIGNKADIPATYHEGNITVFDEDGNPADGGISFSVVDGGLVVTYDD